MPKGRAFASGFSAIRRAVACQPWRGQGSPGTLDRMRGFLTKTVVALLLVVFAGMCFYGLSRGEYRRTQAVGGAL